MKINFKSLYAGTLACLGMLAVSCTSVDDSNGNGGGGNDAGDAYFSVTVRGAAGMASRAYEENGKAEESYVNSLRVVLYTTSGIVAETIDYYNLHNSGQDFGGSDIVTGNNRIFQTVARKVKKQNYKMLVLVNPTSAIYTSTNKGQPLSAFTAAVTVNDVKELTGNAYNDFVMSNWQGLVNVDKDTQLFDEESDANAAPVSVNVERAVAKVMVVTRGPDPVRGVASYNAKPLSWMLDVVNTKTTWMRVPWMAVSAGVIKPTESTDPLDRYQNYAKDPNADRDQLGGAWHSYQAWLYNDGTGTPPAFKNTDFLFIDSSNTSNWIEIKDKDNVNINLNNTLYVVENTMEALQQYRDVTTSVIMKVKFTPEISSISTINNIGEDVPYFVFYTGSDRYVFTAQELEDEYQWQLANNDPADDPTSVEYLNPEVQAFMENISDYRDLLGSNVAFTTYASSASSTELQYDFSFFDADHVNYYRIPIRHYEDTEQPKEMAYGRFGVVRNNIYLLTINHIGAPGAVGVKPFPTTPPVDPPGPEEPGGPDEDEVSWVSTEITILPWIVREHGVSVGE